MKIYKLSNVLAAPFVAVLIYIGYLVYLNTDTPALPWAIVPVLFIILIYLFSPQIDYWWLGKNPIPLDKQVSDMLMKVNPIYSQLSPDKRNNFDRRLQLFISGKEFIGKGMNEDTNNVPHDIKSMISQIPVTMTLHRKEFTIKNFDRIVLYKHPFPTPRYKFLHTAETMQEDGVIILSLEHVQKAIFQKGQHYDVAWHAFAEAFVKSYPAENYPDLDRDIWDKIEQIGGIPKENILATLGFETIDVLPILINYYFNYRQAFMTILPEVATQLRTIFE